MKFINEYFVLFVWDIATFVKYIKKKLMKITLQEIQCLMTQDKFKVHDNNKNDCVN